MTKKEKVDDMLTSLQIIVSDLENLKDEVEVWRDNTPENMQQSDKFEMIETFCEDLEIAEGSLSETIEMLEGIDYPE